MNLGIREERVNVTELTTKLGKTSEVVLAAPESHLSEGYVILLFISGLLYFIVASIS